MTKKMSVCMATYNGAAFIREQIDSILIQISLDDELIICDDCSTDNTIDIVQSYQDPRIKLFINETNLRHVKNFERAIGLATGDLIALTDQDDVWYPNRLAIMKTALLIDENANLVVSNFDFIDSSSNSTGKFNLLTQKPASGIGRIIAILLAKGHYYGCTFLMTKKLALQSLPFPDAVQSHDIWIGMVANTFGETIHLEEPTLARRIHKTNATPVNRRSMSVVLPTRLLLIAAYVNRVLSIVLKSNENSC
jgi:glycosyltransferase involved in cell wall biosynthesis